MRATIAKIEKVLNPRGYGVVKGKEYFYIFPLRKEMPELKDSTVMVPKLNCLTMEQWQKELEEKLVQGATQRKIFFGFLCS